MAEKKGFQEEERLDLVALIKDLWDGRKTILIVTGIFMALGLLAAFTMKRTYTVNSVMVPQLASARNTSLASLAGLTGFDLGTNSMSSQERSPLVYPHITSSVRFKRELMHAPLHYSKCDTLISLLDYSRDYDKPSAIGYVLKYTIGLPGTIIGLLKGLKGDEEEELPGSGIQEEGPSAPKPIKLTKEEVLMAKALGAMVTLTVEKKEGYLVLTVIGSEPLQTAELAMKAQDLLQQEITRFRTEKAQRQLEYVQARYNEIKAETEAYQTALATVTDRSQNMASHRDRIEYDRLMSKYTISSNVYLELSKQLEQAKMQVKRDTPVLAIIQPIAIPDRPSNSRAKTLIVWTLLGGILGCGIALGKRFFPKVKELFAQE